MYGGPKKLVIKPFKPLGGANKEKAEVIWASLSVAIDQIFSRNVSNLSFEVLYRYILFYFIICHLMFI